MQARTDLEATKKRIADSERRIDEKLPQFVDKKYWWAFLDDLPLHAKQVTILLACSWDARQISQCQQVADCVLSDSQTDAQHLLSHAGPTHVRS